MTASSSVGDTPRAKVLVVDDDPTLRATLHDWLALDGCEVRVAGDGLEALEIARWEPFDVVVTDLRMPHLDGLGFLMQLKSLTPTVQVIFLSGEATKADTIEALREGRSFDFLEKPLVNFEQLSRVIERALAAKPVVSEPQEPAPEGDGATEHPLIDRMFTYLHEHLHEPLGLRDVADAMGYSPSYLTALVRQVTGQPVMQWVATLRLAQAKHLLEETDRTIVAIAESVGIPDAKYFARQFRRAFGVSPHAWRERAQ